MEKATNRRASLADRAAQGARGEQETEEGCAPPMRKRCLHGKHKKDCVQCNPCPHGKLKSDGLECNPCPHGKVKGNCAACNPCPHGKLKGHCAECRRDSSDRL